MKFPEIPKAVRITALAGFGIGIVVLGVLAFLFMAIGGIDVAADKPHGWLTEHLLHFAFNRSVAFHSDTVLPPADLEAPSRVKIGAQHYDMVCSNCHGGPGIGQSSVSLSMTPRPQSLPAVVRQFTDPELFWIVKHGVKFSAMPSWPNQVRNDEVWSMVAFLKQLPTMTATEYRAMTAAPQTAPDAKPIAASSSAKLRDADTQRNTGQVHEYLYAVPATGFSDARLLKDPLPVCARCHGSDGSGGATGGEAPNLTIQDANYLRASLNAYAVGNRKSGFMQQVAGQLTEEQIKTLADYYAGLPNKASPQSNSDPSVLERGKYIATQGIKSDAVPACATCHEGVGSKAISAPHIAGQSQTFLRHELEAMRYGGRGTTGLWNPMSAVAHDFSDSDIAAVSAYYASLPADQKAAAPVAAAIDGDKAEGEKIFTTVCVTCHFKGGQGDAYGGFPNLTIQTTPYIAQALRSYRAGTKQNVQMNNIAHGLEDKQIANLATYLNSLPAEASPVRGEPGAAARGAMIAKNGIKDRGIPSCMSCHSAEAIAQLPLIARLQGQNANYLKSRLDYFQTMLASKDETALNPMPAIARQLSDSERADVAAYFASQPPLEKTSR